jgi:hypothetical protein
VEKRDELAMFLGAAPVLKTRGPLDVRGEPKARLAPRAGQIGSERVAVRGLIIVDDDEEAQDGPRAQREVLPLVEPDRAARMADVTAGCR